jgi:hypothetical protein
MYFILAILSLLLIIIAGFYIGKFIVSKWFPTEDRIGQTTTYGLVLIFIIFAITGILVPYLKFLTWAMNMAPRL